MAKSDRPHRPTDQPDAADAFSMILSSPDVPLKLHPEGRRGEGVPLRPRRFIVPLPVRYRLGGTVDWYRGVTANISRSGLLLRIDRSEREPAWTDVADGTPIEMVLELPKMEDPTQVLEVRCQGSFVRALVSQRPDRPVFVGVTVRGYWVEPSALDAVPGASKPAASIPGPGPGQAVGKPEIGSFDTTRRYSRAKLGPDLGVWADICPDRSVAVAMSGRVATIGAGGAFVEVREDYPLGSVLSLRFKLPSTFAEIICWAIVRDNLLGRGVGVEFSDIAPVDRARIHAFVNQYNETRH